jgi:hypothetical protein
MKIINNTNDRLYYLVTPSGTTLSGSKVIASGVVDKDNTLEFPLNNAGQRPIVYVKSIGPYDQGYFSAQPEDGHATVTISITTT